MNADGEEAGSPGQQASGADSLIGTQPPVKLDEVDRVVGSAPEPSQQWIGFQLSIWILALIAAVLIGIGAFGLLTYPSIDQISNAVKDNTKAFEDYQQARAAWFSEVKDLIQLIVVSLLVPLLASVIGYVFGRREQPQLVS